MAVITLWWGVVFFVFSLSRSFALSSDGVLLLSFKYSVQGDPFSVLENWDYNDESPCSWKGVFCSKIGVSGTPDMFRVTGLVLSGNQLLGSIPEELGMIKHLRHLDLSANFFNGSLPVSIFNASELQFLYLSKNRLSGEVPELIGGLKGLQLLNLSGNAFSGRIPGNLTVLQNLTVVSLKSNYFSGDIPGNFRDVEILDLSSNLLNGSLPLDFGGDNLRYLNLSFNEFSGIIPPEFAKSTPISSTIDLSFNNLSGAIPESLTLLNQTTESFAGNENLCGKPLKNLCSIPSSLSTPPNVSTSAPAIAAIPKTISSSPVTYTTQTQAQTKTRSGLKPSTIAAIVAGDLAGILLLSIIILYVYQKRKNLLNPSNAEKKLQISPNKDHPDFNSSKKRVACPCLVIKSEETSEATSSDSEELKYRIEEAENGNEEGGNYKKNGLLVTVDGETELEMETLLKASAYILGASGGSIVYKAVIEDGTALAVRRIAESGVERVRDFESQVRAIAKLKHPNLVRVRGFYWGKNEKLVICDYVSNGSLTTSTFRKSGLSPSHLSLEIRLKIARGIARGLAFIHEKKHVHGNIKPSNILLNSDMEPLISDLGLGRLVFGETSSKANGSGSCSGSATKYFGSQRFNNPREVGGVHDGPINGSPGSSTLSFSSTYQAPESLKNLKPNPKWDVYSFGVVLLELLSGRVFVEAELAQWTAVLLSEDKSRVTRMVDVAVRGEVAGREDAIQACFRLGFSCVAFLPQKRPTMKEALQVLSLVNWVETCISH